jgi:hypothetical protein
MTTEFDERTKPVFGPMDAMWARADTAYKAYMKANERLNPSHQRVSNR